MKQQYEPQKFRFFREILQEQEKAVEYRSIRTMGTFIKFLTRDEVNQLQQKYLSEKPLLFNYDQIQSLQLQNSI